MNYIKIFKKLLFFFFIFLLFGLNTLNAQRFKGFSGKPETYINEIKEMLETDVCLLYTSPSPRDCS